MNQLCIEKILSHKFPRTACIGKELPYTSFQHNSIANYFNRSIPDVISSEHFHVLVIF